MLSPSGYDAITAQFETSIEDMPRISTASTKPNYTSLKIFQEALDGNALTISCQSTPLGMLALSRSKEDYEKANNGIAFIAPTAPGDSPVVPNRESSTRRSARVAGDSPSTEIESYIEPTDPYKAQEAIRVYTHQQQEFTRYNHALVALRNCILKSCNDEYTKAKKKPITRYALTTPLEIMTHLWDTYGGVTEVDLKANEDRMKVPWNPPTPIETLFLQLEEGQEFALEGNEKIDDTTLVRLGYDNVVATGQFTKYCTKWRNRKTAA